MSQLPRTVYLVDDDPEVLRALERLLTSAGLSVSSHPSPEAFLAAFDRHARGCLVLDLAMPGLTGLDLQRALEQQASELPVIFLTGRGDIATTVQAMKHGALDFLTKPVDDATLLAAIDAALAKQEVLAREHDERDQVLATLAALTPREREVLERVVAGRLNKQIAGDLGLSEKTVKFHRGNLMHKLGVRTVADLVRLAHRGGIGRPAPD